MADPPLQGTEPGRWLPFFSDKLTKRFSTVQVGKWNNIMHLDFDVLGD